MATTEHDHDHDARGTIMTTTMTTTTGTITPRAGAAARRSSSARPAPGRARWSRAARSGSTPSRCCASPREPVSEFSDDLRALVERMITLMDDANGVGLAGNQVGLLRRVLVYRPDREDAEARALVNPVIVERSDETAVDEEGCLSLGPLRVPVERNVRVSVEAQDENGEPVHVDAENLEARILQHEIDHLDGVLTIDRTPPESRREALAALRPQPGPRR